MALTEIHGYAIPHNNGNGGGGGTTYIKGGPTSSTFNSLNVSNINASNGNIDYLKSKSISANDAEFIYLLTREGTILKLTGNELKYNSGYIGDLNSENITAKKITTDDLQAVNAYIKTLQSYEITTDYLTVTKQAHFFELVIDKIRSVGGIVIITPASCEIDYVRGHIANSDKFVVPTESNYTSIDYFQVFWRATNDDGKNITNDFVRNDQVICQSLGNIHEGTNNDVANKYYWRLVTQVGYDNDHSQVYVNLSTGDISFDKEHTTDNEFEVIMYNTQTKSVNSDDYYYNEIEWEAKAQEFVDSNGNPIGNITTNTKWNDLNIGNGEAIHGIFRTHSQQYGMYIKPKNNDSGLNVTSKLSFKIRQKVGNNNYIIPDRITIGVYFKDDTYMIWQDVSLDEFGDRTLDLDNPDSEIEMIIIMSTADVNWHLCNCMNISNVYIKKSNDEANVPAATSGCDYTLSKKASIPEKGDNLVQLGYRGIDDAKRQSAIIIAAYQSPDAQITPPSYAQYMGINDFNLSSHRKTYFDANSAEFYGTFTVRSGNSETSLSNYINSEITAADNKNMWKNGSIAANISLIIWRNETTIEPSYVTFTMSTYDSSGTLSSSTTVPTGYKVEITGYSNSGATMNTLTYNANSSLNMLSLSPILLYVLSDNYTYSDLHHIRVRLLRCSSVADGINSDTKLNDVILSFSSIKDGEDGEDAEPNEIYRLNVIKEIFMAGLVSSIENSPSTGELGPVPLVYDLNYSLNKVVDGKLVSLTAAEYEDFAIQIDFRDKEGRYLDFYNVSHPDKTGFSYYLIKSRFHEGNGDYSYSGNWFRFAQGETNYNNLMDYSLNNSNLMEVIYPTVANNHYHDYMKCYTNYPAKCPICANIEVVKYPLTNNQYRVAKRQVYVQLETGAVFKVFDDKIVSAIADSQTGQLDLSDYVEKSWLTNNYNTLYSDAYKTTFKMNGDTYVLYTKDGVDQQILYALNGGSEIEITSQMIRDAVGEIYTKSEIDSFFANINDDPNYYKRDIDLWTEDSLYNNDYYYPILVYGDGLGNDEYPKLASHENGPMIRCQVDCGLDEFNYSSSSRPSWGGLYPQDSHNRGVALVCNWSAFCNAQGEWNSREKNVYINTYELKYTRKSGGSNYDEDNSTNNIKVIGGPSDTSGIVQNNGYMIFYLRGGAKYNFRFDWPNIRVKPFPNGIPTSIISNGGSQYGVIAQADSQALHVPQLDRMWRSEILRQADRISLNVWSGDGVTLPNTSEGAGYTYLRNCGIDIGTRNITLKADKVHFTNTAGTVNDKIWIDPTAGTLHATNGEFSGTLKADRMWHNVEAPESNLTITASNLKSFYFLVGPDYQSLTITLPAAYNFEGCQIQMFRPMSPTSGYADWTLATPSGTRLYIPKTDGTAIHDRTSVRVPYNELITLIANADYWYVLGHKFTSEDLL